MIARGTMTGVPKSSRSISLYTLWGLVVLRIRSYLPLRSEESPFMPYHGDMVIVEDENCNKRSPYLYQGRKN
jgi:hypothetical protein